MKRNLFNMTGALAALLAFVVLAGCDNGTTEAKEAEEEAKIPRYAVTFNTRGGSAIAEQEVKTGSAVAKPADPTRTAFDFAGWYYADDSAVEWPITVTADVMVYARWSLDANIQPGLYEGNSYKESSGLIAALDWIKNNAASGGNYTIVLGQNETITLQSLDYTDTQVTITLVSKDPHTITFAVSPGPWHTPGNALFTVGTNTIMYLEDKVTLDRTRVKVNGGRFIMNGGKITGNETYGNCGGVYVNSGTFTMNGGEISENTANTDFGDGGGGGVSVASGTFTMNGGTIRGNDSDTDFSDLGEGEGGGVYIAASGTFTMNGGTISGNTASGSGGGVYASIFTMNGGTISENTSRVRSGGGVYASTFRMNGGTISGNTASGGGGVYVAYGTFTMNGGTISGNTARSSGGGVYVYSGTFTMNGGEISGNINTFSSSSYYGGGGVYASTFIMIGGTISGNFSPYGGGVYIGISGFTKSGGIIHGSNAEDELRNRATSDSNGHAVYLGIGSNNGWKRNTTARASDAMDGSKDGAAGGWE